MNQILQCTSTEGLKKLDLNSKPAIKEFVNRVAVHIPNKWMEIGIQFEIPHSQLQAFKHECHGECSKILVEIFNYWEKQPSDKPKTWSTVIDVLRTPSVGEHTLACHLESTPTSS